jgi:3-hydroxyisobutyrate dehydrogenase-like beta-hydroxyacid dehydrogenase
METINLESNASPAEVGLQKKRVGFIGLGQLGNPMAKRILAAGFPLTVYNRTQKKTNEFPNLGAMVAKSPKELAQVSDVIFSVVSDDRAVKQLMTGDNGVIYGANPGTIVIEMSTTRIDTVMDLNDKMKPKGIRVLDAPVSGRPAEAQKGELTIMAGGDKQAFDYCLEIFRAIAKNSFYVGDLGTGRLAKFANNMLVTLNLMTSLEVTSWVMRTKLDPKVFVDVMRKSRGYSPVFEGFIPGLVEKSGSNPHLWLDKDLEIALEVASKLHVPMPFTSLAKQFLQAAKGRDPEGEELTVDFSSIVGLYRDLNKTRE